MAKQPSSKDFQAALDDIRDRFPKLKVDDLFVQWFLRAYLTESEEQAAAAVSGGSRDKGIDAIFVDDSARMVFVVQGKYHKDLCKSLEKRADVVSFAEIGQRLSDPDDKAFEKYLAKTDGLVSKQLQDARKRVLKHDYRICLYFVTLGNVSASTCSDADAVARAANATIEVIDGKQSQILFRDYLDGVAPQFRLSTWKWKTHLT